MKTTVLTVALIVLLAGCGSSDDGQTESEPTTSASGGVVTSDSPESAEEEPAAKPVDVVRTWLNAYDDGDADVACALQTDAHTATMISESAQEGYVDESATCSELVGAIAELYKAFGIADVDRDHDEIANDGTTARVLVTYDDEQLEASTFGLVFVDGQWLVDSEID